MLSFEEAITKYDPIMGMEVHVELGTKTKMFCGCPTTFGAPVNSQVCPVCLGLPGSLPVVNAQAVEYGIKIGLALNCEISRHSEFARKNYFYPDQPKDYQISQYDKPIAFNGYLDVPFQGSFFRVEIERAHLEEDTGKATHKGGEGRIQGASYSLLDYNRAGVPLIEIVTRPIAVEPSLSPELARAYVKSLRELILNLGVSDVRMDQGSLRCDVNLSLKPKGATKLGTRTETKNVNSLRSIASAVDFEIRRQATELEAGREIVQETRHFQEQDGTTLPGRKKETSEDYRYFPDPDLPVITPEASRIQELKESLPSLPWLQHARYQEEWGVSDTVMRDLINLGAIDLIANTITAGADVNAARSWWSSYLPQLANTKGVDLVDLNITPYQVAEIIKLIKQQVINKSIAQKVFEKVIDGEGEPLEIVEKNNWGIVQDNNLIAELVTEALEQDPEVVVSLKSGKMAAIGRIIGYVMKKTGNQANAQEIKEIILKQVGKE